MPSHSHHTHGNHSKHDRHSHRHKDGKHKKSNTSGSSKSKLVKQAMMVLQAKRRANVSPRLTSDDYEARKPDFRVWLARCKGLKMDGMKSDDLHVLFERFSRLWNHSKLDEDIYDGTAAQRAELSGVVAKVRTVSTGVGADDASILSSLRGNVAECTSAQKKKNGTSTGFNFPEQRRVPQNPAEEEAQREAEIRHRKMMAKRRMEDQELILDQIAPAETGRDALIAKRMNAREERRARGDSPDADIYGNDVHSSESYEASLERRKAAKEAKAAKVAAEKSAKYQEYQKKEAEKIAMFQQMAQQYGYKIRDRDQPPLP